MLAPAPLTGAGSDQASSRSWAGKTHSSGGFVQTPTLPGIHGARQPKAQFV